MAQPMCAKVEHSKFLVLEMSANPLVLLHLDNQTYLQFAKVMSCINEGLF